MNKIIFAFSISIFALASAPIAQQTGPIRYIEVAQSTCAAEWKHLKYLNPNALSHVETAPVVGETQMDPVTLAAWGKYMTAISYLADYVAAFVTLIDGNTHRQSFAKETEAKYRLATCLLPDPSERENLLAYVSTSALASKTEASKKLFQSFDQFQCMGFGPASEKMFTMDTEHPSFPQKVADIQETYMKVCPDL